MKILGVSEIFPHRGRPTSGRFVVGQCRSVAAECDVQFLSPRFYSPIAPADSWLRFYRGQPAFEIVDGIPAHYAITPAWPSYFYMICQTLSMRWALPWRAARLSFDLVHAHGVVPAGDAALRIAKRRPLVVTAYGSDLNLYPQYRSLRPLVRRVLDAADVVVTVSRSLGELASGLGRPKRIEWIPIGYDPAVFFAAPDPRPPVVLYAGRLFHGKGIEELGQAFAQVRRERPDARLRLLGDGPLHIEGEGIEAVGAVPQSQVAEEMRAARVFCLPSHREGWPASAVEALASGLRVVGTDVGGLGELLRGAPGARTVPVGDAAALARALLEALEDSTAPEAIAKHVAPFTWSEVGKRYVEVYRSLL